MVAKSGSSVAYGRCWSEGVAGINATLPVGRRFFLHARQAIRHDLDPVQGRRHVQLDDAAGLRNAPLAVERTGPEAPFKGTAAAATKIDAPGLAFARGVLDRRQRQTELGRPSVVRAPGSRLPWRVPVRVQRAPI